MKRNIWPSSRCISELFPVHDPFIQSDSCFVSPVQPGGPLHRNKTIDLKSELSGGLTDAQIDLKIFLSKPPISSHLMNDSTEFHFWGFRGKVPRPQELPGGWQVFVLLHFL